MVSRPPPKASSSGGGNDEDRGGSNSIRSKNRNGLEWSLRSMHKIDTSAQHFLNSYYGDESESENESEEELDDQTAYDIFKGKDEAKDNKNSVWSTLSAPLRTGIVDGKKVVFELHTDVTQKPATSRSERLRRKHVIENSDQSNWEIRLRFRMMHFSISFLSIVFLVSFLSLNVVFAGLFLAIDGCCNDGSHVFSDMFAFAVQTSTTIGYGGYSPVGKMSNFFVVLLNYASTLMTTLFAGLLFTKFVTPVINIQFSDVMTLCNVNGVPCLSFRLGNADGKLNSLTDINVRLSYTYQIPYTDHNGKQNYFRQTEDLKLLSNRQHGLDEVWTLRHVLDEMSPLFGLHFDEHPANKIFVYTLSIDAVQDLTKSAVNVQTEYAPEDVLIGHNFVNLVTVDQENRVLISDYSKISDTESYPVWYPSRSGAYGTTF